MSLLVILKICSKQSACTCFLLLTINWVIAWAMLCKEFNRWANSVLDCRSTRHRVSSTNIFFIKRYPQIKPEPTGQRERVIRSALILKGSVVMRVCLDSITYWQMVSSRGKSSTGSPRQLRITCPSWVKFEINALGLSAIKAAASVKTLSSVFFASSKSNAASFSRHFFYGRMWGIQCEWSGKIIWYKRGLILSLQHRFWHFWEIFLGEEREARGGAVQVSGEIASSEWLNHERRLV